MSEPVAADPGSMSYSDYLHLPELLSAQHRLSSPAHHDELLFIVQHQTSELWLKLLLHELRRVRECMATEALAPAMKSLARVKQIQRTLTEQWSVLGTLTPSEYSEFRGILGSSSGFQSWQYRAVEFLLGNKNASMLEVFASEPQAHGLLSELLGAPSVYDAFLGYLSRHGYSIPAEALAVHQRAHTFDPDLVPLFRQIYDDTQAHWQAYEACEALVDVEEAFQLWRFRHLRTVQRIIGMSPGTGGSSGVGYLRAALDLTFFPELYAVRTELSSS